MPFIYTNTFTENKHEALFLENLLAGIECFIVRTKILHAFAYTIDRQDLYRRKDAGDEFVFEYITAGERPDRLSKQTVEEYCVKKRVRVIGGDEQRTFYPQQIRPVYPDGTEKQRAK